MTKDKAKELAAKFLSEHFTYQYGIKGIDDKGNCIALKELTELVLKGAK